VFSRRRGCRGRAGVSLIEVAIALTLLGTVLVSLGGLMFQVARHTRNSAAAGYRSAAATDAAAWAEALPWDSIAGAVGCQSDTVGDYSYTRCLTMVDTASFKLKRLTVVIAPTGPLTSRPDTVLVYRNKPRSYSPFYVP
jgi:Tfp pilus assembly protein PilV